jgi:hypothetical protein
LGVATLSHENSGGNSGGFLKVTESGANAFEAVAPSKFLGSLLSLNGRTLSFDSRLILTNSQDPYSGFGKVTIVGANGVSAERDLTPNPPGTDWATYSANLAASDWGVDDTTWKQILANVSEIRVVLESIKGNEIVGFDNFKLQASSSSQPVPEPASMMLLGIGLAGCGLFARKKFINV